MNIRRCENLHHPCRAIAIKKGGRI